MKTYLKFNEMTESSLFEVEGGWVTTAPQLGIFVIAEWFKSLFS